MFKSIEYKLVIYLLLLILSVSEITVMTIKGMWIYVGLGGLVALYSINRLYSHYRKFNQNIIFLLNALENGDYSFHFSETRLSMREKELNTMLNRIKDILSTAREEVIRNERFQSLIVESVSTGIIIVNDRNVVQTANRAAMDLLGLDVFTHLNQLSVIDRSFPQLFSHLDYVRSKQIRVPNEREEVEVSLSQSKIQFPSGQMRVITMSNIGNELEAREMESWVKLIRVMTHEIMNSIAPVTSLSDTLLMSYRSAGEEALQNSLNRHTVEALETINSTARGLLSFVESYRKFTGIPKPEPKKFELIPLVCKIVTLQSQLLADKNIGVILPEESFTTINADENQISQVVVNLVKNAIEATPEGGTIKIEVKSLPGDGVQLNVCNTGEAVSEEVVPHIFVPFFTTKDTGTGIGLSVSRYIMRLHGGNLKYHHSDGWTVFSMVFK